MLNFLQFINERRISDVPIISPETYISGMNKGSSDKLFFLNKINTNCIVDFGCADGSILRSIQSVDPTIKLIGYDIDDNMLNRARSKSEDIEYYSNWG